MREPQPSPAQVLREVARLYTRAQRVAADCCSTTSTQCHLLTELGRTGAVSLAELGLRLCLEKSWVSRAVDGLAAEGLVTREPNPRDARSWLVTLTAKGAARVDELNQTLDNHAAVVLGRLGERERTSVEKSLRLLAAALREDTDIAACCPGATGARSTASCC